MVDFAVSMAIVIVLFWMCRRVATWIILKSEQVVATVPDDANGKANSLSSVMANAYVCPLQDMSRFERNPTPACPDNCGPNGYGH